MNPGTIIVAIVVALIVAAIVFHQVHNKKKGKSICGCGGNCGSCPGCGTSGDVK